MCIAGLWVLSLTTHEADVHFGQSRLLLSIILNIQCASVLIDNVHVLVVMSAFVSGVYAPLVMSRR